MEESNTYPSASETHLFADEELIQYEDATTGQRFANYLVDYLLMQFAISFATGYLLARLLMATSPKTAYALFGEENYLASFVIALFNHLIYYTICEKLFKGYTLGKLITGTRAIREDGGELTFKDAFLRSLSRLVPLEAFSIWFGDGLWHDRWTKTRVVKTR